MNKKIVRPKMTEVIQFRCTAPKKSFYRAIASIYAGGNMSMLIEDALEDFQRKHLVPEGLKIKKKGHESSKLKKHGLF